jgi:apolipoprotein D and lipocalin family protein
MSTDGMRRLVSIFACSFVLAGCGAPPLPPLALADRVDLTRFMGDWYVIASIPTFIEKDAHNAVESYRLAPDGSIETIFRFRAGSFDGEQKRYEPRGFVADPSSNAIWGMQFLWPFRSDYRIAYVASDYSLTVVARESRDYAWIMARSPEIADTDYERLARLLAAQGYDIARLRKVPQRWT